MLSTISTIRLIFALAIFLPRELHNMVHMNVAIGIQNTHSVAHNVHPIVAPAILYAAFHHSTSLFARFLYISGSIFIASIFDESSGIISDSLSLSLDLAELLIFFSMFTMLSRTSHLLAPHFCMSHSVALSNFSN